MKSIYTYYKERLIEISGKNRSLYLKSFNKKNGYDIGRILTFDQEKLAQLMDIFWNGKNVVYTIVGKDTKEEIVKASHIELRFPDKTFETDKEKNKYERQKRDYIKRVVQSEVSSLKTLKREIDEIEKETGRYELFLCYPFVYGTLKNYTFKAPLIMFPVVIDIVDENTVNIYPKAGETVQLNKALLLAFADAMHLNLEDLDMEYDCLGTKFKDISALIDYLKGFGIRIDYSPRKKVFDFNHYGEPGNLDSPEVKHTCLLARCSLANSIYSDYSSLEKRHLANDSINELLNTKKIKHKNQKCENLYLINNVDYAQEQVVKKVNEQGNMVIYGPPGTGKSQTIVNVISDAICKGKRVLVVSQKKAAMEVVYNRLATLNQKAMFLIDAEKEKRTFYERCFKMHTITENMPYDENIFKEYDDVTAKLNSEINNLNIISNVLTQNTDFGISLQSMYYNSFKIGKRSGEYPIYKAMLKDKALMKLNYEELSSALEIVNEKNKAEIYYNFVEEKKKNPFIDHLKSDLSVHDVAMSQAKLRSLCSERMPLFDLANHKYSREILTYYSRAKSYGDMKPLAKMIAHFEQPKTYKLLKTSYILFPMYPYAKVKEQKAINEIYSTFKDTLSAMDEYIAGYDFLKNILSDSGYVMAIDGILNGNSQVLRLLLNAVESYIEQRDVLMVLNSLSKNQKIVLDFAYKNSSNYAKYKYTLEKLLPIRIYHEVVKYEDSQKEVLSRMVDFENIRTRIVALKKKQNEISKKIALQSFCPDYQKLMDGSPKSKDYLYQISKKQNFWPIRKTMEIYGEYLFKLFPCWLLSPENVSTILPLKKDMFDIVLFDEASQVFIENTIPTIYRGKTIVVAGDAKQLRPTTTFMKRYMGSTIDEDTDYSIQAALEVESLLDLAVSRFSSTNITYHYRSQNEELIDFSNSAFYSNTLQIAPNISKNIRHKPIERILVDGTWKDRKNITEAKKVVDLVKNILKTRKNGETIGIITFNVEQESAIEDIIDKECFDDEEFRSLYLKEKSRVENGEDVSLFVKNLENVQGDERDIIIFSIAYAKNEFGKVNAIFGSLSAEGGENRLNVAITRAKKKIYVVTSIEPEELKVDNSKFMGPKLLRSYLAYVRAVSNGNNEEVKVILNSVGQGLGLTMKKPLGLLPMENQIAEKLNKLGYKTEINLGNSNSKISVAIYDKKKDRYLLGIETDQTAISSSTSTLERDVFKNQFLTQKGWNMLRIWSRDWWHNAHQVISSITKLLEKQKNNSQWRRLLSHLAPQSFRGTKLLRSQMRRA